MYSLVSLSKSKRFCIELTYENMNIKIYQDFLASPLSLSYSQLSLATHRGDTENGWYICFAACSQSPRQKGLHYSCHIDRSKTHWWFSWAAVTCNYFRSYRRFFRVKAILYMTCTFAIQDMSFSHSWCMKNLSRLMVVKVSYDSNVVSIRNCIFNFK